ncbi:MAG: hypothetical protein V7749_13260 [Cocleimonas sp.]
MEIELTKLKELLSTEIKVKEFLAMEIELTKLKQLLTTEIKLKEFLVQEIDLTSFLSNKPAHDLDAALVDADMARESLTIDVTGVSSNSIPSVEFAPKNTQLTAQLAVKKDLPAYDFSLIDTLIAEHKEIRFIYNRLMSLTIEKKYAKVASQLESFNGEIREHYQKADTSLYAYLRTYVQIKYPQREKAFAQLSLEMKNNSIEIFYIISQSPNIPLTEKTYDAFMKEFMAVGKLMNERINREKELLFKMYEQTNVVKSIS